MVEVLGMAFEFIPFFFILAIVYGGLQLSKLFENKAANMILALAIGAFGAATPAVSEFIYAIMGPAVILFVIFFFIGFVWKFAKKDEQNTDYTLGVVILGLLVLGSVIAFQPNTDSPLNYIMSDNLILIMVVIFIAVIFYAAYKSESK